MMHDLIEILASATTPFIAILIITDPNSSLGGHLLLLFFLLNSIFCLSFILGRLGADELGSVGVAS